MERAFETTKKRHLLLHEIDKAEMVVGRLHYGGFWIYTEPIPVPHNTRAFGIYRLTPK